MLEWFVIWWGFKNGCQNDMCLKEIGPHAQKMNTFIGSIVNLIEGIYMTIQGAQNTHFDKTIKHSYEV